MISNASLLVFALSRTFRRAASCRRLRAERTNAGKATARALQKTAILLFLLFMQNFFREAKV